LRPDRASRRRLARGPLASLLAACALAVLAAAGTARAQPGGDLPEQLRTIAEVRFRGAKHLGSKLKKEARLKTHEPSRLPWRERPTLRLDYLRADTAAITALYRHYGYLDARAHWVIESTPDPEAARIVFVVDEGRPAKITEVKLEGAHEFKPHELTRSLLAKVKRPFDPAFLALDTLHLSVLYQERGHRPRTTASYTRGSPDSLAIVVTYQIDEGPRYTVGRIDYESTGKLKESLARRELLLKPGETFRRSYLERSVQRLYDTGLYSQVQVSSAIDTSQAKLDMLLRVSARRPRWVDLGIGSGSVDLLRFTGTWGNRNLNHNALLGSLGGELTVDQQRRSFEDPSRVVRVRYGHGSANLVEPWLFGLRLQGQTGVFYEGGTDDRDPRFLQRRDSRGVEAGLSREFSNIFKGSVSGHSALVHQSYEILTVDPASGLQDTVSNALPRYYDNGLALSLFRDTRDDRITPGRGSIQALVSELAGGPFAGASSFRKLVLVSSWYTPRANGWTIATRFSGGIMSPTGNQKNTFQPGTQDSVVARVPRERRFFIGGVNSMRGFDENSILPDGGLAMLLLNVEARIPLRGPFGAEAYVDIGNVWSRTEFIQLSDFIPPWEAANSVRDIRYTAGVGARLLLPFGPLRMDLTWSKHPEFAGSLIRGRRFPFNVQFAIGPSF
jgi:outer membrane protein insertion porin family